MIDDGDGFHHIGVACADLTIQERAYAALGYVREGKAFDDPQLGVRGMFLRGNGPRLEILVDRPGARVISPWLEKGVSMYHLAFQVSNLAAAIARARADGAKLIVGPLPAVAFGGRSVAFVMLRNRALIELIASA
jgi:catechol 2,3-dioxygenase-like lactoylglutathione lyase family enzyme